MYGFIQIKELTKAISKIDNNYPTEMTEPFISKFSTFCQLQCGIDK